MSSPPPVPWYSIAVGALREVRQQWRSVALLALVGAGAGAITALFLPSYYRSGAAFQAESAGPQLSGTLAGLASQVGGFPFSGQSNAQLLGDLLTRDAVLRRVTKATFPWSGRMVPLADVYGYANKPETLRDFYATERLRAALQVNVDSRTGVVRFEVEARSPELAEALAESTLAALNQANIALRQARAAAERAFTAERAEQARKDLAEAERAVAAFYQRNRVITGSPTLQMEEARLRRVVDMAQQVYVQLRLQEEQAAVQELRNTPAISVIDPPIVPVKRSWPKRRLAVLTGLLVALSVSFARLALAPEFRRLTAQRIV
jgi:uncharacterized protein involved in exopolysaccharide biosynthesis